MTTSILIADDDKEIVDLVKLYLQNEGYTIYQAYDGAEVWRLVQEKQPTLVILDIMMPEMNGLEVCRLMRDNGILTPILMLSAKAEDNDKIMGLLTGADGLYGQAIQSIRAFCTRESYSKKNAANESSRAC